MSRSKVAISLDQHLLLRLDRLVKGAGFPSRSQAIQVAIEEKLERIEGDLSGPSEDKLEEELQAVLLATQTAFDEIKSGCRSIVERIDGLLGHVRGAEDA